MAAVRCGFLLGCALGQVSALHTVSVEDHIDDALHDDETDEAVFAKVESVENIVEDVVEDAASANTTAYDCDDGFANWRRGWSGAKMHWCCMNKAKGCPESNADIKARKKAESDMAKANNKSANINAMKKIIAQKVAIVQQKQQAVVNLEAQVTAKNALLKTRQEELEKLYETTAKKDTKRVSLMQEGEGKAKAVRMREYGVKMQEEDIVERLKQVDIKTNEISSTLKRSLASKQEIQVQHAKLQASLGEVNKATAEFLKKKKTSELEMRANFASYKKRKDTTLEKKAETNSKKAALKSKVHDLTKQEDSLSQQEWEMQDREQALGRKLKRVEEEKEERAALVTVQSNSIKNKEDKVNSQMNLVTDKKTQINAKKKAIRKLESQLALLEGRDGSVMLS